jgi:hypothetical protein
MHKALVAYQALRSCGINVAIGLGSVVCRVGPDPRRDVVAWCGRLNRGELLNGCFAGHCWLYHGNHIYDPTVGSLRDLEPDTLEIAISGKLLGAVQWDITLPR